MVRFNIKFQFTTKDDVKSLPHIIKDNVSKYIGNRYNEFNELDFETPDIKAIRLFCHKTIGSASSYHLHQLDEISRELQRIVKEDELKLLPKHVLDMQEFFKNLRKKYYKA